MPDKEVVGGPSEALEQAWDVWDMLSDLSNDIVQKCQVFLPKALLAVVVLFGGVRIIHCVMNGIHRQVERVRLPSHLARMDQPRPFMKDDEETTESEDDHMKPQPIDPTFVRFGLSIVEYALKLVLVLCVASMVGIKTTSFLAVLSMAALAVGLALKNVIEDIASGVLLIIFRPFKVGDLVEVCSYVGRVSEVSIFRTIITRQDNQVVILPNHLISFIQVIINTDPGAERREDIVFRIAHDQDILQAKAALFKAAQELHGVSKHHMPKILVSDISEVGIDLTVRVWMHAESVLTVPFHLREEGLLALKAKDIALARLGFYRGRP